MSMIDSVRETVLAVLNKNNYGYISPMDFNLFAKQAQLDLFEDYFYEYNKEVVKQNQRISGSGHADIGRQINEVIDTFTQYKSLPVSTTPQVSKQTFDLPTDWYTIVDVTWGQNCEEGTSYANKEAERVSEYQIRRLLRSNLTAPSPQFPAYIITQQGFPATEGPGSGAPPGGTEGNLSNQITLYPAPPDTCTLSCGLTYVRYPKDPMWTYKTVAGNSPLFFPSATDYQDFELPLSDETDLVLKILQYSGMSIRELSAVQFAKTEEMQTSQENK